jgi:outer membrane receptor for ferrienterochelin and colicins
MKRLPVFFACLLACYTTCEAQIHRKGDIDTTQTSRSYNLNPVVVTGSGHHQRLKSTATPVHVMSKREIQEQGITTFDQALTRMMPQTSMAPNSMGTFLRLNGLGNKYILILINGQKVTARQTLGRIGGDGIMQFQLRRGNTPWNPMSWLGK